jgi:hypothetical protein
VCNCIYLTCRQCCAAHSTPKPVRTNHPFLIEALGFRPIVAYGIETPRLVEGHQSLRNSMHPSTSFLMGAKMENKHAAQSVLASS